MIELLVVASKPYACVWRVVPLNCLSSAQDEQSMLGGTDGCTMEALMYQSQPGPWLLMLW